MPRRPGGRLWCNIDLRKNYPSRPVRMLVMRVRRLARAVPLEGLSRRWATEPRRLPRRLPGPDWAVMSTVTGPLAQLSRPTVRPRRFRSTGPSARWRIFTGDAAAAAAVGAAAALVTPVT